MTYKICYYIIKGKLEGFFYLTKLANKHTFQIVTHTQKKNYILLSLSHSISLYIKEDFQFQIKSLYQIFLFVVQVIKKKRKLRIIVTPVIESMTNARAAPSIAFLLFLLVMSFRYEEKLPSMRWITAVFGGNDFITSVTARTIYYWLWVRSNKYNKFNFLWRRLYVLTLKTRYIIVIMKLGV